MLNHEEAYNKIGNAFKSMDKLTDELKELVDKLPKQIEIEKSRSEPSKNQFWIFVQALTLFLKQEGTLPVS